MVNWSMALLGAAIIMLLFGAIGAGGGLRWWRRRRPLMQFLLMILVPSLMIGLGLLVLLLFFNSALEDAAGLMFGLGLTSVLLLVATSYLVDQIRVAFGPPDDPPDDEQR